MMRILLRSALLGGLACAALVATAQAAEIDYAGKTVTIVSCFAAGGGYDTYARLYAAHLAPHLAGRPSVVVKNMPGAGGLACTNYLYSAAPRDGTVQGIVPQTVAIAQLLDAPGTKFDVGKFNWLGRINSNIEVQQLWHTSKAKSIEDVKRVQVVVAGTGPDSSSVVFPRILDEMLGMKFKVVPGYEGVSMVTLAMERGEVESIARPWALAKTAHPEWLKDKTVITLVQYTAERNAELADVPAVVELAETPEQRAILSLYTSGSDIGRSILAPPGLSDATVADARRAFDATMRDAQLLEDIERAKLDFDPLSGDKLQALVVGITKIDPALAEKAKHFSR
jgi:tripartite-type tricarboxylate transporter receptor subunit TctC